MYREFYEILDELKRQTRFDTTTKFIQHGDTSVYEHSIKVAILSLKLAEKLKLKVDKKALIRGALLHDYFLYDWHDKGHSLHGFTHPYRAYKNAKEELDLNEIEKNIIIRHMFPFTPIPPKYREAWLVCLADKISTVKESISDRLKKVEVEA